MKLYDNPDVEFVIPDTGGLLFVDNMMIPEQSQAYADAHTLMDFWYTVGCGSDAYRVASATYSPVHGVSERVLADAQAARDAGDEETAASLEAMSRTAVPNRRAAGVDPRVQDPQRAGRSDRGTNLFNEVLLRLS